MGNTLSSPNETQLTNDVPTDGPFSPLVSVYVYWTTLGEVEVEKCASTRVSPDLERFWWLTCGVHMRCGKIHRKRSCVSTRSRNVCGVQAQHGATGAVMVL